MCNKYNQKHHQPAEPNHFNGINPAPTDRQPEHPGRRLPHQRGAKNQPTCKVATAIDANANATAIDAPRE